MTSPNTLESALDFLTKHQIDDDGIYEFLASIDTPRLTVLVGRLKVVDSAVSHGSASYKRIFEGRRSALKGRIYEQIVALIVRGVKCFASWQNIQSSTNELDILIILGPSALHVPALRTWGSHCICECKYHQSHVSTNWVSKLNTVLQTHNAQVGLLFSKKGVATSGRGTQVRHALQLLAAGASPRYVLNVSWDDIMGCVSGDNFLKLVARRYVEVNAGLERLSLAAS